MDAAITVASPWKSLMIGRFSIKSRNLWVEKTRCKIWPMFTSTVKVFTWNAARKRDEMLELYDGKLSRTVLRRESGSNSADLAGTIFGGFAPNSQTAEVLSKALGSRTVMSGSVSKGGGKDSASRSLQMMERPLMTPDELKSIPKGQFVVMKTGTHPMQTRLRLFLDWGISFGDPYLLPERAARTVAYANKQELEQAIFRCHHAQPAESDTPPAPPVPPKTPTARGGASYAQARRTRREPPPPVVVRTDGGQE